ncbi:MAG: tetratricopeptide repeat protein [Planctomycetia bacterium]|nr:tetratricopeptide repeat protein [Planctomycetia bacterium]
MMWTAELRLLLGAIVAVFAPFAVLSIATPVERAALGLGPAPFGWSRVLLGHLVLALPLGFVFATWMRSRPGTILRLPVLVTGGVIVGAVALFGAAMTEAVVSSNAGPVPALFLRVILAAVLVAPWCLVLTMDTSAEQPTPPGRLAWVVSALIALIPAGLYAEAVAEARTKSVEELLARGRYAKAVGPLKGLCELGSERPVSGKSPNEVLLALENDLKQLRKAADWPIAGNNAARVQRAAVLIALDRLDEAENLLLPMAARDPVAMLMLASIYRDQEKWSESDEAFNSALAKLLPHAGTNSNVREMCVDAFEGLAYNARHSGRPEEVEAVLRRALESLPAESARFHFLLGQHFHDGGRPGPALDHLRTAADLDPANYGQRAEKLRRDIRTHNYGCFILPE